MAEQTQALHYSGTNGREASLRMNHNERNARE
jgi:hypothetical protein